jgi:hypothetical protein
MKPFDIHKTWENPAGFLSDHPLMDHSVACRRGDAEDPFDTPVNVIGERISRRRLIFKDTRHKSSGGAAGPAGECDKRQIMGKMGVDDIPFSLAHEPAQGANIRKVIQQIQMPIQADLRHKAQPVFLGQSA